MQLSVRPLPNLPCLLYFLYHLGKTKKEQIDTFGQPFRCQALPPGGEVCRWYDGGMSLGSTDPNQHLVYFTFGPTGQASAWDYQGA